MTTLTTRIAAVAVLAAGQMLGSVQLQARDEAASPWIDGYNSRVRLIAAGEGGKIYAGIAIEMAPGWKTYWRNPGDSGGVPPNFDWSKSTNLLSAVTLYPAPKRLKDPAGDAIGYSGSVIFPARIVPADAASPVKLSVQIEYGICKEICVPAEARLELELPVGLTNEHVTELSAALDAVPRVTGAQRAQDPKLVKTEALLDGDKPRLTFEIDYAGGVEGADVFIEAPEGIYVPQPQPMPAIAGQGNRRGFVVDLAKGADPAELRGKKLTLTMVGAAGHSQAFWQLD